jgi:O-antigen ligase
LYRNGWAVFGLGIAALPFVIKFSKPMIVLLAFCLAASFLLAGYLNPKSVNLIFSRFKLRILFVAFALVMLLVAVIVAINALTGGAVEDIIRWYFLKQRVSASGAIVYADISGGRLAIWRVALESWSQRPLFGYGLGAELEAYSKGWVVKTQFHSYLVQALHNTGLVGLFLICSGWLVWTLRSLRRVYRVGDMDEKIILGSMLVYVFGIAFYGMFGHSLSYPPSTQFFWLCIGFLSVRRRPRSLRVHA